MRKANRYLPAVLVLVGLFLGGCAWLLQPLTAKLAANPTSGHAPLSVTFSAAGSTGPITAFTLDFGDGSLPYSGTDITVNVSHTYKDPGTYNAVLTVQDAQGRTATDSVTITATTPPQASVSLGAFPPSGPAPLTVDFWAQVEAASGTRIKHVALDVDTDGTPEFEQDVDFTSYDWWIYVHTYPEPGEYTATLAVTDDSTPPKSYSATVTVTVTSPPPQITAFTVAGYGSDAEPVEVTAGENVIFAFQAQAGDPSRKLVKWEIRSGNGYVVTKDEAPTNTLNVVHEYSGGYTQTGSYIASVKVWDDLDNSDTAEITIEVVAPAP